MLCFRCGSHNPDGSEFCGQCGQKFVDKERMASKEKLDEDIKLPPRKIDLEEKAEHKPGDQFADRYEITDVLGVGPLGTVYRAHDLEIDVDVALKLISPKLLQTRNEKKHFLQAIREVRKINHPNVVRVYDEDQDGKWVFFTMQSIDGLNLRKIIRLRKEKQQRFINQELTPIFSHVCQALDRAHETTVHGDLKPENIIVLPDMLKVTDFTLFNALPRKPFVAAQKAAGEVYAYLAPELRESEQDIEVAADIYSLGVILCEMLSGEIYQGPSSGLPRLPKDCEPWLQLLNRALNENPSRRHRSIRDFFEAFLAIASRVDHGLPEKASQKPAPTRSAKLDAEVRKVPELPRAPLAPWDSKPLAIEPGTSEIPPTVVDTQTLPREEKLPAKAEEELVEPIASMVVGESDIDDVEETEEGEEAKEFEEEPAEAEVDEEAEPFDEAQTVVASPVIPPKRPPSELRVARPVGQIRLPQSPIQSVQVLDKRRHPSQPEAPRAAEVPPVLPAAAVSSNIPEQNPYKIPYPQPSYGPFSQPPFPPTYSQLPMPRISRAPLYIFLSVVLVAVSVGTYFLVDYLRAQADLARAQARVSLDSGKTEAPATISEKSPSLAAAPGQAALNKPTKDETMLEKPKHEQKARLSEEPENVAALARKAEENERVAEAIRKTEESKRAAEVARKVEEARIDAEAARRVAEVRRDEEHKRADRDRKERDRKEREQRWSIKQTRQEEDEQPKKLVIEEIPEVSQPGPPSSKAEEKVAISETPAASCPNGMVFIPAGKAYIGSDANDPMRNFGEINLHLAESNSFCIDRYEFPNVPGRKPKVDVSWKEADQLCRKQGKRLCAEEEWEYSCKGKGNRRFPYGSQWDPNTCNTEDVNSTDRSIASSGSFPSCRSPFGVFDMSGNVSEWTASRYSPAAGDRTHKGGSATRPNYATRCASRSSLSATARKSDLGLRCCANIR